MFVYGITCSIADLSTLPPTATGDYYTNYDLLVFPEFTRTTSVKAHGTLSPRFWAQVKALVEFPQNVIDIEMEHPFINDMQSVAVDALKEKYPGLIPSWYYVPKVHSHTS